MSSTLSDVRPEIVFCSLLPLPSNVISDTLMVPSWVASWPSSSALRAFLAVSRRDSLLEPVPHLSSIEPDRSNTRAML
ncbi:hypothetical protein D3C71_1262950 [compost metagenome]